ncbi:MAG: DUF4332 domain-containing protein [Rhizobiales bacterium]|nr:DUF4332 domain-containing protein [Hyphomicrobiales bacterium]
MRYKIETVEGIAKVYGEKLRQAGVKRTDQLLERGASKKGRKELADVVGIDEKLILKWTNFCDLMRIRGVGEEYSELLEAAGVDTVKELKMRKPDNLHKAMVEANAKRKMVRQLPSLKQVEKWVAQAKELPAIMTY